MQTQVLGLSVDSVPSLQAWAESMGYISYPLLSDFYPHGKVAKTYGVLRDDGRSERALFIIDKERIIRYVDVHDIDDQPDNEELFRELRKLETKAVQLEAVAAASESPQPETTKVTLYCTPTCPSCRRARTYLKANRIPYEEIDVTKDREAAQRLRGWAGGNETTPTLDINGEIIINFNRERIDQALGLNQ